MHPLSYLLLSLGLSGLALAIVFQIAWVSFGKRPYARMWSVAFLFSAGQWFLNLFSKGMALPLEAYWMLASACSAVTLTLSVAAFRMRAGLRNAWAWYAVVNALDLGLIAWFLMVQPHLGLRMAIGPLYASVMMLACVHAVLRVPHRAPADWGMVVSAVLFGLCQAAAAVAVLGGGAAGTPEALEHYRAINFLTMPAAYMAMGLFTVLILASDMSKELQTLAETDPLTGVLNLRGLRAAAQRALAQAAARGDTLAVIACDVDHFKQINDRHGHAFGDHCLRSVAQHLRSHVERTGAVGRLGGEEFVVLLAGHSVAQAGVVAEDLRCALQGLDIRHVDQHTRLTASFGVSAWNPSESGIEPALQRADAAVYRSKGAGRNRVSVAEPVEG